MKVLCIRPRYNTPGKKDVTGAFAPEAEKFLKLHGDGVVLDFDNRQPMPARRKEVLQLLQDVGAPPHDDFEAVAFFTHGWIDGIQAGFTRATAGVLAQALEAGPLGGKHVVLYCCSTGKDPKDSPKEAAGTGENSFADKLRDALCAQGSTNCRVTAHTVAAHTTMNPFVKFFDGMGSTVGGVGGYYPVAPRSELWAKWRDALKASKNPLRFEMPFMTVEEIHDILVNG